MQEEPVMQAPADDGQSKAIKKRATDLRRMLQQRLGPVIFERCVTVLVPSECAESLALAMRNAPAAGSVCVWSMPHDAEQERAEPCESPACPVVARAAPDLSPLD